MENFKLMSEDSLTEMIRKLGISTWADLKKYVQELPYGRISDRTNLELVLIEKKGTCSSKHGFLKIVAELNSIPNVKLMIGIFKMSKQNTPKIGNELDKYGLQYMPEAHCFLIENSEIVDITSEHLTYDRIKNDFINKKEIEAEQVGNYKVQFHKDFLKEWLSEQNLNFSFEELWEIRNNCIANLEK